MSEGGLLSMGIVTRGMMSGKEFVLHSFGSIPKNGSSGLVGNKVLNVEKRHSKHFHNNNIKSRVLAKFAIYV